MSMKNKNFDISNLDFFGTTAQLQPGEQTKYVTQFGGVVWLIIIISYLGFVSLCIEKFISIEGLEQKFTQSFENKANAINYTDKLNFAIGYMNDTYTRFTNEALFDLTLSFVKITNKTKIAIPLRPCLPSDFKKVISEDSDLKSTICYALRITHIYSAKAVSPPLKVNGPI